MILIIDVGNTMIDIGIYESDKLIKTYRTRSDKGKTIDEYISVLSLFFRENCYKQGDFEGAMISSVVPSLDNVIAKAVDTVFGVKAHFVGAGIKTGMPIRIDHPNTLGADLASDGVGAISKYGYPVVIVDLGTATKILFIDDKGAFQGGVIAPGLAISMNALVGTASLLSEVNLKTPKHVISKNTADCMNGGAIFGTKHMILGLVADMEKEAGYQVKKVLTGGNSAYLKEELKDFIYDPQLVLDGIYSIYRRNFGK